MMVKKDMARAAGLVAGYAALGPITGFLAHRMVCAAERRQWLRCGLYAAGIPASFLLLAWTAATLGVAAA